MANLPSGIVNLPLHGHRGQHRVVGAGAGRDSVLIVLFEVTSQD